MGGEPSNDGDFVNFEGGTYRGGFLYKSLPLNAIDSQGITPTIAELERFQEGGTDELQAERECTRDCDR